MPPTSTNMSEDNKEIKGLFTLNVKDLAGLSEPLKRVVDCLDKGISSLMHPFAFKRDERAKMVIEQERSNQNAIIALKEAMAQDIINVARTSRDRNELHNIAEIYGGAMAELQGLDPSKLPANLPSDEWSAHFFDCAKDCSDDQIRVLWAKILAGEIKKPGKYYKRTLTCLKQIEKHEAEWFAELCKMSIENAYVPDFILDDNKFFRFNQFQSLVDCGFVNGSKGTITIDKDCVLECKSCDIDLKLASGEVFLHVFTFTDTGFQICQLLECKTDDTFVQELLEYLNKRGAANACVVKK